MTTLRLLTLSTFLALPLAAQDVGVHFTNGVDGYLETGHDTRLVPQSGLTVEAWITYDDQIATGLNRYPTIVRQHVSGGNQEAFFLRVNANTTASTILRCRVTTTAGRILVDWPFAPGQLNAWTHVAATYDGAAATIYVNGVAVSSTPGAGLPLLDAGGVFRIGKGADSTGPYEVWNGDIDEVRVWPFARTAAEIQATMNEKLASVPGRVTTWNLDNSLVDSSNGIALTATGQAPFTANPLTLATPTMPIAFGASSPGCLGDLAMAAGSAAHVGNAAFVLDCTRTPPNAAGLFALSFGTLSSPLSLLGIDIWVGPNGLTTVSALADGLGTMRMPLGIPGTVNPGGLLAVQAVVLDPCGAQGLTASNALAVTIQP